MLCIFLSRCKHGKVDRWWSLANVKWKWFNSIYLLPFFMKEENIIYWSINSSNLWWKKSKKSLHILEDGASGVQVGDIEQLIL